MSSFGYAVFGTSVFGTAVFGAPRVPAGTRGPAVGDVVLAQWGDRGRRPLPMSGLVTANGVNVTGEFSGLAALSDVRRIAPDVEDLRGWWLFWEHETLAPFGGPVTDVVPHADRTVEIAARGWLELLAKRLTRKRASPVTAPAGAIAGRLVGDAAMGNPTGIYSLSCDEWGEHVTWQDDGGDLLDALSQLSQASGQDYGVGEDDRVFRWRRQWGSDKRDTVQLVQGYHLADWRPSWSIEPIVTEVVLGVDDPDRFKTARDVAGHDAAALAAFGLRQARGTYKGRLPRPAVEAIAAAQAATLADTGRLIEFDVANVDGCWAWFRRGDTITVILTDLDRALVVRCLLLSWDQDSDVLRVSGEVVGG